VANEGSAWRLWVVTPPVPTLASVIGDARRDASAEALARAYAISCEAVLAHATATAEGVPLGDDLDQLGWAGDRSASLVSLWVPSGEHRAAHGELATTLRHAWRELALDPAVFRSAVLALRRERPGLRRAALERFLAPPDDVAASGTARGDPS
jgi:hypothetical protein